MKPAFHTILVPVDFSPYSTAALHYAAGIADRFSSSLVVLHVIAKEAETATIQRRVTPRRLPLLGAEVPPLEVASDMTETVAIDLREQGKTALQHFLPPQLTTRPLEPRVVVGRPVEQILDVAQRDKVDLIVLGTHGRTGLAHAMLGSVAERVVRLAPCPVLTVRERGAATS